MRLAIAEKVQVWPVDEDEILLPKGFHNDFSDLETDVEEDVFEVMEDTLVGLEIFGAGSALPAGVSFGGV